MGGLGAVSSGDIANDQELDERSNTEISQTFYQFVHEWERAQSSYLDGPQLVPGSESVSESPFSVPGDFLQDMVWERGGYF